RNNRFLAFDRREEGWANGAQVATQPVENTRFKRRTMLTKKFALIAVIVGFIVPSMSIFAQDAGALLDLLVKKKLISDQEAEEVRAELTKQVSETSGGKWKLSTPITEIELYGDIRLRYQYNGGQTTDNSPLGAHANGIAGHDDSQERERERYRLRLGLRGTLVDDWFFGIRFETNASSRSTNVTFGDEASGGPFAKNSDTVNEGQAYLGYKGFKDVTLTVGRMPNPLVTTLMTWDPDINPEGLAEQWKHTYNFEFGGGGAAAATEGYSKEGGKGIVATQAASEPFKLKLDLFAHFAQFVYADSNPENPLGPRAQVSSSSGSATRQTGQLIPNTDAFLLAWQVGAKLTFP